MDSVEQVLFLDFSKSQPMFREFSHLMDLVEAVKASFSTILKNKKKPIYYTILLPDRHRHGRCSKSDADIMDSEAGVQNKQTKAI